MKTRTLLLALLGSTMGVHVSLADSTVHTSDRHAYGANIGWTNWKWDTVTPDGASLEPYLLRGKIYAGNVGWIDLGDGAPADGVFYAQTGGEWGVNHDGSGGLTGWAYGANIGWIRFDPALPVGPPRVDLGTGALSGHAYSSNVGWIDLAGVVTCVDEGTDSDGDGIADAWEHEMLAGDGQGASLGVLTAGGDSDGDGFSDLDEYHADTNPFDSLERLQIVSVVPNIGLGEVELSWSTWSPRRAYTVNSSPDLQTWSLEMDDLFADTVTLVKGAPLPGALFFQVESAVHLCP